MALELNLPLAGFESIFCRQIGQTFLGMFLMCRELCRHSEQNRWPAKASLVKTTAGETDDNHGGPGNLPQCVTVNALALSMQITQLNELSFCLLFVGMPSLIKSTTSGVASLSVLYFPLARALDVPTLRRFDGPSDLSMGPRLHPRCSGGILSSRVSGLLPGIAAST